MRFPALTLFLSLVLASAAIPAASVVPEADIPDARDHPLIDRYPGSVIDTYSETSFDGFSLAVGPGRNRMIESNIALEGRITIIRYAVDKERSVLEVFRNYEIFFKGKGYETLYACSDKVCGGRDFNLAVAPYTSEEGDSWEGQRYLAAILKRPEGDLHVALYVTKASGLGGPRKDQVYARLSVIESKPMDVGLQHVTASEMAEKIEGEGRIALYGILFDYDKDVIKPESRPALDEIAKLLNEQSGLKLYVVGHTDSEGNMEYNRDLSQRRAAAVVADLIGSYDIPAERLTPFGVSFLAPIASNRTEEGRAKNRRVELVERPQ